ncbi:hypothetical protein [Roseovarius atlanticus]|uniref:hypothetical protein n=1 Tax=Roseovarius atlanticus TaxID=1641875 RepID=UPI001187365F|nr:hypothetical protein [Roseovarius atlanticus]
MDRNQLDEIISSCLQELYDQDGQILAQDIGECAICGRLAMLMGPKFPLYSVDIEYNRKGPGLDPKDIEMPDENGELTTHRVFPDIIIHERGHNLRNFLVVEVKKSTNAVGDEHDLAKLQALCRQLRYQYGLFLRLSTGPNSDLAGVQRQWVEGPVIG